MRTILGGCYWSFQLLIELDGRLSLMKGFLPRGPLKLKDILGPGYIQWTLDIVDFMGPLLQISTINNRI